MRVIGILIISLFIAGWAWAAELTPEQQKRANALFWQIRCPTCSAQPVAESDASLSIILRNKIETSIAEGQSDEKILQDLTATYGDDIRLLPKTEVRTLPLWLAPWLIIGFGGLGIFILHRRKTRS